MAGVQDGDATADSVVAPVDAEPAKQPPGKRDEVEAAAASRHAAVLAEELALVQRLQQLLAESETLGVRMPVMETLFAQAQALHWNSQVRMSERCGFQ
jgi:hypothetical protein